MNFKALVSDKKRDEYIILNLVKHAAHVTLKDLDNNDRFNLIIFFNYVKIEQELVYITRKSKKKVLKHINKLYIYNSTNL